MSRGIAIAGNLLADNVKTVSTYPESGMLADILSVSQSVGGCVPNTIIDLAKMGSGIPLYALGRVGDDEPGRRIASELAGNGVDTTGVHFTPHVPTSFSDVFYAVDTEERTFFHNRGANARFSASDVAVDRLTCDLLHIGYVLLLDRFDEKDSEYGTVMARFLHDVKACGIQTSIDVVSDKNGRFRETVIPALKYCDYAIMNEIEGCAVSGLAPRDEAGTLIPENLIKTLEMFVELGVGKRVIFHCPEAGFCLDARDGLTVVPSLKLPEGYIAGSVGAGDAFCAGCLHEIYLDKKPDDMLRYASAAAAASLSAADAVSGMRTDGELRRMMRDWERITL